MYVRDLLKTKRPPITVKGSAPITDAMKTMIDNKIGSLLVASDFGSPIGIITENDLFQIAYRYRGNMMDKKIEDSMTSTMMTCTMDDSIMLIADMMIQNNVRHTPITDDDGNVCGILSIRDILKATVGESISKKSKRVMETTGTMV